MYGYILILITLHKFPHYVNCKKIFSLPLLKRYILILIDVQICLHTDSFKDISSL